MCCGEMSSVISGPVYFFSECWEFADQAEASVE